MATCPHCGHDNLVGEIFCVECGQDLQARSELDEHLEEVLLEVLEPISPVTIEAEATVGEAVRLMHEKKTGCLLVVADGRMVGVFTERDVLLKVTTRDGTRLDAPLAEVMTRETITLSETDSIAVALNQMAIGGFRHLPVVSKDGVPTGVYSVRDILGKLCEFESAGN